MRFEFSGTVNRSHGPGMGMDRRTTQWEFIPRGSGLLGSHAVPGFKQKKFTVELRLFGTL